jgi:nucleoporin NUP42
MKHLAQRDTPYTINTEDVKNDLIDNKGRPKWILSTYGPGKNPPASLLEGNEYSSEEIRVRFYEMRANGKIDEANQEASNLWAKAEQAMADVVNNVDNVAKFMEDAEKKHPNRLDFTKVDGTKTREQVIKEAEPSNSLGGSSGFGQPNSFAEPATTFGQATASSSFGSGGFGQPAQSSSFGQAAQPSSFGKPSGAFGQPATSTFGKPTIGFGQPSFGQSAQPVFGQPAQPAPTFGQPAPQAPVFGQPAKPAPVFGQPAPPAPTFGQSSQPTPVFGQPAQSSSSAFGKPAFGSTGFGQPSTAGAKNPFAAPSATTGFGQPSFGQPSQSAAAFGQPSQSGPGFGQPSQPSTGFGQPAPSNPFGQTSQPSPFSQPNTASSAFGQTNTTTAPGSAATPAFGKPSAATPMFGQPPSQQNNPFGTKPENRLANFDNPMSPPMFTPGGTSTMNANPSGQGFGGTQAPRKSSVTEIAVLPPNTNSSATPHPLTNKAPRPLHYTQTIPATAPTVTDPTTKRLNRYRGRPVRYINDSPCYERPDGKGWERIWFPQDGQTPDVVYLGREDKIGDLVAEQERYTDEVIQEFAFLFEMGKYKDEKMPLVPPKREWCLYDF